MYPSTAALAPIPTHLVIVAGTRPEAIKLAPVVSALLSAGRVPCTLIAAGQQADEVERVFAEWRLYAMHLKQLPPQSHWRRSEREQRHRLRALFRALGADAVMVQGDTWSAYAAARAADELGRPLIHVEAGLRSPNPRDPHPEDALRRLISRRAWLHFAPSVAAQRQLLDEGVASQNIALSGSTAVDALRRLLARPRPNDSPSVETQFDLMVTLHRRENWETGIDRLCDALLEVLRQRPKLRVLWPMHTNPALQQRLRERLGEQSQVQLRAPMAHAEFVDCLRACGRIVSDSGGIQEEAPYLGAAALILRRCSERPESVDSGHARLCAPDHPELTGELLQLLDRPRLAPTGFNAQAPWGDGRAGERIAARVADELLERANRRLRPAELAHA